MARTLVQSLEKPRCPQTYCLGVLTQCLRLVKVNEINKNITDQFEEQESSSKRNLRNWQPDCIIRLRRPAQKRRKRITC